MTLRFGWPHFILGTRGDDVLQGTPGNDILVGDSGWGWFRCAWWAPRPGGDDFLDGGAGSDIVLGGRGNDVANYTLSENKRSHDYYDGGKGFDTLLLTLTSAELQMASVQADIAAFEAFLDKKANPNSELGKLFQFKSFDLDVRNFEALEIRVAGGGASPIAVDDAYAFGEDAVLVVAGPGVLANDSGAPGSALTAELLAGPAHGTLALNTDGSFTYTPEADYFGTDSFTYRALDGAAAATATVQLVIAAVNDAPVANDDMLPARADGLGATTDEDTPFDFDVALLLANDTDADGDALFVAAVASSSAFGATVTLGPNGRVTYDPTEVMQALQPGQVVTDSFGYVVFDGQGGADTALVSLTVAGLADGALL
jgi:VCBS repeat-containing protein